MVIAASIEKSEFSTFNQISRGPKGSLPHVRTNLRQYLNTLDERLEHLTIGSYFKMTDNLYGRITAGYLEPMYAEYHLKSILSVNKNYALGAEINIQ